MARFPDGARRLRLLAALAGLAWAGECAPLREAWGLGAEKGRRRGDAESLFLDLSHVHLGTITTEEDKRKYLHTIQLEKSRITRKTLRAVYDNAYDLYRAGDFEGSRELASRILSIDPGFEDASILRGASIDLKGAGRPFLSERKLVENKFDSGMALYRQGRLVEAAEHMEAAVKLWPGNLKARYWLKKVRGEIAEEHFRKGQAAYRQHRLREALDQWYAALVLNPKLPRLASAIAKVESELRQADANEKLQAALQLYSQGRSEESLKALDQVLQVEPGDAKAQRLMSEIRAEVANQCVAEGRRLYSQRHYGAAVAQWKKATDYGYDPRTADSLIARAKEQMRREADARKREEEEARRREEDARKRAEEEAARKAEEERKALEEAERGLSAQPPADGGAAALGTAATEENKRSAVQHWNAGIIYYQQGNYEKAKDEWLLCKQLDPASSDCVTGLQRIEQQFGGP